MASGGRDNDDLIIAALANGATHKEAAEAAGVGERTVRRRLHSEGFKQKVRQKRSEIIEAASGKLASKLSKASDRLDELMDTGPPSVALGAARTILEFACKLQDSLDFAARLEEIEKRLNDQNAEGANVEGATSDDDQPGEDPSGSGAMGG
jgi:hypothetical protein